MNTLDAIVIEQGGELGIIGYGIEDTRVNKVAGTIYLRQFEGEAQPTSVYSRPSKVREPTNSTITTLPRSRTLATEDLVNITIQVIRPTADGDEGSRSSS